MADGAIARGEIVVTVYAMWAWTVSYDRTALSCLHDR